jgi:hypothetical protein
VGTGVFPSVHYPVFEFGISPTPSVEGKNEWNVLTFLPLVNLKCNNFEKLSDSEEIM